MTTFFIRIPWSLCFAVSIAPLLYCLFQISRVLQGEISRLGVDPAEAIVHYFGSCALVFLWITLTLSPLRTLLGYNYVYLRRQLGLFAFFYGVCHLMSYWVFLLEFDVAGVVDDVIERPYITVGMLALLLMLPLAVTSNRWSQKKLRLNWKKLHRLIYPISILIIIHFFWQTRSDFSEPLMYSALLLLLLTYRIVRFTSNKHKGSLKT